MYEELKKLAEELDGEEWLLVDGEGFEADNRFITSQRRIDDNKVGYAEINYGHPDAGMGEPFQSRQVSAGKFIAAANPSAVLALIAAHAMEKGSVDEWQGLAARRATRMTELTNEVDRLKAENEALRKDAERFRFIEHDADSGMRRIYGDDWLSVVDAGGFQ